MITHLEPDILEGKVNWVSESKWASLVAHLPAIRRPWFDSWVGKNPWRRDRLSTPVFLGFPCGSDGKETACNVGDLGWSSGLGRCPGGRHGIMPKKARGCDGIPVELFQILKDDTVRMLYSICQQIWKIQQWLQGLGKVSFHSNPKERQCKRMFKPPYKCSEFTSWQDNAQILQARLHQ